MATVALSRYRRRIAGDEARADLEEEQLQARIDAIAGGDVAIAAVARGEAVAPHFELAP